MTGCTKPDVGGVILSAAILGEIKSWSFECRSFVMSILRLSAGGPSMETRLSVDPRRLALAWMATFRGVLGIESGEAARDVALLDARLVACVGDLVLAPG